MRSILLTFVLLFTAFVGNAQHHHSDSAEKDTFYIVHENIPKSKFWGNSWYTGLSYTLSYRNEFMASFGRTYGNMFTSGGGFNVFTSSWGVSFAQYNAVSSAVKRLDFSEK
jgi:hypothetical protein